MLFKKEKKVYVPQDIDQQLKDSLLKIGITEEDILANNGELLFLNHSKYWSPLYALGQDPISVCDINEYRFDLCSLYSSYQKSHNLKFPKPIDIVSSRMARLLIAMYGLDESCINTLEGSCEWLDAFPKFSYPFEMNWKKISLSKYLDECDELGFSPIWDHFVDIIICSGFNPIQPKEITYMEYDGKTTKEIMNWCHFNRLYNRSDTNTDVFRDYSRVGMPRQILEDYINGIDTYRHCVDKMLEIGSDYTRNLNDEI